MAKSLFIKPDKRQGLRIVRKKSKTKIIMNKIELLRGFWSSTTTPPILKDKLWKKDLI